MANSYDLCGNAGGQQFNINFGGRSGLIIKDSATGKLRLENDDNSKVEYLTAAGTNKTYDGGHWKITDTAGTQYFFGRNKLPGSTSSTALTNSVDTLPVGAATPTQPCYNSSFAASLCTQAAAWKLDYVVDVLGNSSAYYYEQETNWYKTQAGSGPMKEYIKASRLARIDYGMRAGQELTVTAPQQILLSYSNRCEGIDCAKGTDVPTKFSCSSTGTCANYNATFYTDKRLSSVTTRTKLSDGTYQSADKWSLKHTMPDPGDGTTPALWLGSITHDGANTKAGTVITDPPVVFSGQTLQNRVWAIDGLAPLNRYRLTSVKSPSGAVTAVSYVSAECSPTNLPASPESNNKRCFPQWWQPTTPIVQEARLDYFHIYPVASVSVSPGPGAQGSESMLTRFQYIGTPAWRYPLPKYVAGDGGTQLTWSAAAGWKQVKSITGPSTTPTANTTTLTTFLRGLDGSPSNKTGGTRTETITTTTGEVITDSRWFSGQTLEAQELLGETGAAATTTTTIPRASTPTATGLPSLGSPDARYINTGKTTLKELTAAGSRQSISTPTFDSLGRVIAVSDTGDSMVTGDETCTRTTYADNASLNLFGLEATSYTYAGTCTTTGTATGNLLTASETFYDASSSAAGGTGYTAPTKGNPTGGREAKTTSNTTVSAWQQSQKSEYDALGRVTKSSDSATGTLRTTTMSYSPATGPVTTSTTINPKGWTTTQGFDPVRGQLVSATDENGHSATYRYDANGRQTGEWGPTRPQATNPIPTVTATYFISQTAPSWVKKETVNATGAPITSFEIFDGLGRIRQSQEVSPAGGSIVTDTMYDVHGNVSLERNPYYMTDAASGTLRIPTLAVPSSTEYSYDALGRTVKTRGLAYDNTQQWIKQTTYAGLDTATTTGPGTVSARRTVINMGGQPTTDMVYRGQTVSGTPDTARMGYDALGNKTSLVDASGNRWTWTFDAQQRQIATEDPDTGTNTFTFDNAGRKATHTDEVGTVTGFTYDVLDRLLEEKVTVAGGTAKTLSSYTYDVAKKGKVDTKTRYNGTNYDQPVTTTFAGYNAQYQPGSVKVALPAGATGFNATYETKTTYGTSGLPSFVTHPAVAGLPTEMVRNVYDPSDRPSALIGQFGDTYAGNTQYDNLGGLATYSQFDNKLYTAGADTTGATRVTYNWDPTTGRLAQTTALNEAKGIVSDLGVTKYTYDAASRLTARDLSYSSRTSGAGAADYQCYTYDYAGHLASVWTPSAKTCSGNFTPGTTALGGAAPYAQTYTYNLNGDRQQAKRYSSTGTLATTEDYTYPAAGQTGPHRLASVKRTNASGVATTDSFTWDAAGRLTNRAAQLIAYTPDGRIQSTQGAVSNVNPNPAKADGAAPVVADQSAKSNRFYDADGQLVASVDGTGTTAIIGSATVFRSKTGQVSGTRTYAFSGKAIAQRLSTPGSTVTTVNHIVGDTLNTAQVLVGPTTNGGTVGVSVVKRHVDPFGLTRGVNKSAKGNAAFANAAAATGGTGNNGPNPSGFGAVNGYISGLADTASALVHLGARDLDRALGIFTAPDRVLDLTSQLGFTPYLYSMGDPINSSDPSGLSPRMTMIDGGGSWFGGPKAKVRKAPAYVPSGQKTPIWQQRAISQQVHTDPPAMSAAGVFWLTIGIVATVGVCTVTAGAGCVVGGMIIGGITSTGQYFADTKKPTARGFAVNLAVSLVPIPGKGALTGAAKASGIGATAREATQTGAIAAGKSGIARLPQQLTTGRNAERGVQVYLGLKNGKPVYAGITKDTDVRGSQHKDRFDRLRNLVPDDQILTRGEARAIEQALIVRAKGPRNDKNPNGLYENKRNEISPNQPYYKEALDWGEQWLVDQKVPRP
ncbi:RHS repeat domain-containing protein [Arthrobacter sp. TMT4-20]